MLFLKQYDIADNERAFLYEKNRFNGVLEPGRYRYFDPRDNIRIERFDITDLELKHVLGKFLVSTFSDLTGDHLIAYQLKENEVGLLYCDQQLVEILTPGSFKMVWQDAGEFELKRIDISDQYQVDEKLLSLLGRGRDVDLREKAVASIYYVEVQDNQIGLLQIDGKLEKLLQPSNYGFWKFQRNILVKQMDLRLQNLEVTGQEILTKDRVSLRVNLSASYRVIEPEMAYMKLADMIDFLYREFQLQLREAVGTKTLDQLLADKTSLNDVIEKGILQRVKEYGIEINNVGVRDIILPGDMKTILNQVVEAEKAAEANLIKRREETAATRSLHNTAKVMEGNPTLMRLKELEVLEKVTERIGNINVYSGLEGVMKDLIRTPSN